MSEPIMACATPRGVASALALLRLSGEDLATRLQDFWGRPRAWCPGRVYRDRLPLPGGLIEDCLWTFFQAPRSYTGEDVVEISCHGNPLLVEQIEQALRERGFRQALPGEFTLRAVQRGRMGLVEAEGLLNYLEARSLPALVAAGKTLGGSLDHRYRMIGEMIGGMRALVEGSLEFSDTDGCASTPELLPLWEDLRREMDVLGQVARTSQQMARGLQVVLVGRPNVGKSSLFNRLLGVDRALVSELAGTTRDALREEWRSEGITLSLWDVAGALETDEALDRMGVEKARETALAADLVLWVVDPEYPGAHQTVPAEWLRQDVPLLGVINRVDERSREAVSLWDERMRGWGHDVVRVSARTGEGVNLLRERLVSHAHRLWGTVEQTGMLGAYQREVVARARAHLWRAEELWQTGDWVLLAETLRWVDREWSALVGNRHPEDLMNRFFASFCVGK